MYDWLERELHLVKTAKFHVVDGRASPELRAAILRSQLALPESYKEFVLRFGTAKLYRNPQNDSYRLGVFAGPREAKLKNATSVFEVGFHDGARVFIEPYEDPTGGAVWEAEAGWQQKVGDDFGEWLAKSCADARARYAVETWDEILRGPRPFTAAEQEIIEARRHICWRLMGIDADGNHVFEIRNSSRRRMPALTIGVRSKDMRLNGAVVLRIGHVGPGQTDTVHASCYKGLRAPEELEVFDLPEPTPEDREFYSELTC